MTSTRNDKENVNGIHFMIASTDSVLQTEISATQQQIDTFNEYLVDDAYTHYPLFHYNPTKKEELMKNLFPPELAKIMFRYVDGDVSPGELATKGKRGLLFTQTLFGKPLAEAILLPVATRAATLILGGDEHEVEEAIKLAIDHPEILRIPVVARDRSGSPEFRLMTDETDAELAKGSKHLYLKRAADNGLDYKILDARGKLIESHITPKELSQEIKAEPVLTLPMLQKLRGSILTITSQCGHTPLGRAAKGTLLKIAAMAGDVNLQKEVKEEKDRGVVERLAAIRGGLTPDEVAMEVEQSITGKEAERQNQQRVDNIMAAIIQFGEGVLNQAKKYKENKQDHNNFKALQTLCQPLINQLGKALQHDPKEITTSGYLFDPVILQKTAAWFENNLGRFEGWWSILSDVFWVNGFGQLQARLSARDKQTVQHGIDYVIDTKKISPRYIYDAHGFSCINFSSGCGVNFFLDHYGHSARTAVAWGWRAYLLALLSTSFKKFILIKSNSIAKFVQYPLSNLVTL